MSSSPDRTCRLGWSRRAASTAWISPCSRSTRPAFRSDCGCAACRSASGALSRSSSTSSLSPKGRRAPGFSLARQIRPTCADKFDPRSPMSPPLEIRARECSTPATFACSGLSAARFPSSSAGEESAPGRRDQGYREVLRSVAGHQGFHSGRRHILARSPVAGRRSPVAGRRSSPRRRSNLVEGGPRAPKWWYWQSVPRENRRPRSVCVLGVRRSPRRRARVKRAFQTELPGHAPRRV